MNISIFGLGYVGCVSLGCLAQFGHKLIGVDTNESKVNLINRGKPTIIEEGIEDLIAEQFRKGSISATTNSREAILNSEISIIAVGTPSTTNGHLNLDFIFSVAESIGYALREKEEFHVIIIRSTIFPGTCEKVAKKIESISQKTMNENFAVVSNPEFLREGSAIKDYFNPPLTLIGADNHTAAEKVAQLYGKLSCEIVLTDIRTAEIMKFVNNTFHALKISFANEIGNICSKLSIDSHLVMDILCRDTALNISSYYFKPGFAYGGSCLPKDLKGLQTLAHDLYVETPIINSIDKTNDLQIIKIFNLIQNLYKKKIGFLGISFKAGTDDLRNSPAVLLVEKLIGKGYHLKIYDKNVKESFLTGTNKQFINEHVPHVSDLLVNHIDELIIHSEILVIATKENEYTNYLPTDKEITIIDLVRIDESILKRTNYYGANW